MRRRVMFGAAFVALLGAGAGVWRWRQRAGEPPSRPPVPRAELLAATGPLVPPDGPLRVYHLGHSLVGRDMPAILAQMAGHEHASQLGWGASLRNHWEDGEDIPGFATENDHARFVPAHEAMAGGQWDAVILTEMVELRDAIRWHGSAHYLARWIQAALAGNPDARLYLYETWHRLDDAAGWLERIDTDLPALWEGELLQGTMAWGAPAIHLIPGGQALAAAVRAAEAGDVPGLGHRHDFMARAADGAVDPIHPGDAGNYLIAATHYSTLYHRPAPDPDGPVSDAAGRALDLAPATMAALHDIAWDVVQDTRGTGVAAGT